VEKKKNPQTLLRVLTWRTLEQNTVKTITTSKWERGTKQPLEKKSNGEGVQSTKRRGDNKTISSKKTKDWLGGVSREKGKEKKQHKKAWAGGASGTSQAAPTGNKNQNKAKNKKR